MLYIKYEKEGRSITRGWHYSEPLPPINARVVTFQADGDELILILEALKKTTKQ